MILKRFVVEYIDSNGELNYLRVDAKSRKNAERIANAAGIKHADVQSIEER